MFHMLQLLERSRYQSCIHISPVYISRVTQQFLCVLLWAGLIYSVSSFCIIHSNEMSNWNILFTPSKLTQRIRAEYPFHICMPCARRIQNILLYAPCIGPISNEISLSRHSFLRKVFFNLRANLIGKTESIESTVRYQSGRSHCSNVQSSQ
jgi:hypothetical protein